MDRNSLIGFVLIAGIFFTWMYFFQPEAEPTQVKSSIEKSQPNSDNLDNLSEESEKSENLDSLSNSNISVSGDSLQALALKDQFGAFSPVATGTETFIEARTDDLVMLFSSKGGKPIGAWLSKYKTYDSLPLPVIDEHLKNRFAFTFAHGNRTIETDQLYFTPVNILNKLSVANGNKPLEIRFRAEIAPGRYIDHVYELTNGQYDFTFHAEYHQLADLIRNKHIEFNWTVEIPRTEKSVQNMRNQTTIYYKSGDDVESLNAATADPQSENIKTETQWVAFKNHYFNTTVIPEIPFEEIQLECTVPSNETYNKEMKGVFHLPTDFDQQEQVTLKFVFSPNSYSTLKSYDLELDKMISMGWSFIGYINKYIVLTVFKLLEDKIANYGIIILILALLIRVLVFPLAYRSYVSMAKMRIVNESQEVKELEEKYKNDNTRLQTEKMSYYSSVGVSPLSGCIPLVLQMPIILAMFSFFPASIELRQQSFLWATDLSSYDSILDLSFEIPFYGSHVSLFTLLMTLSTIAFTYVSQQTQGNTNPQMKQLQWMGYVMPIIFLGILNNYAAGLSYYYFLANVLSISQSFLIKASINDKKLLEQLHAVKAKKKSGQAPKGRMASWLEKQQKKQEEMKRQIQKNKNQSKK